MAKKIEGEPSAAEKWADLEPMLNTEHALRRIRVVSGQTHFLPRERLEFVEELVKRAKVALPAHEKASAEAEREAVKRKAELRKDEERALRRLHQTEDEQNRAEHGGENRGA